MREAIAAIDFNAAHGQEPAHQVHILKVDRETQRRARALIPVAIDWEVVDFLAVDIGARRESTIDLGRIVGTNSRKQRLGSRVDRRRWQCHDAAPHQDRKRA